MQSLPNNNFAPLYSDPSQGQFLPNKYSVPLHHGPLKGRMSLSLPWPFTRPIHAFLPYNHSVPLYLDPPQGQIMQFLPHNHFVFLYIDPYYRVFLWSAGIHLFVLQLSRSEFFKFKQAVCLLPYCAKHHKGISIEIFPRFLNNYSMYRIPASNTTGTEI